MYIIEQKSIIRYAFVAPRLEDWRQHNNTLVHETNHYQQSNMNTVKINYDFTGLKIFNGPLSVKPFKIIYMYTTFYN